MNQTQKHTTGKKLLALLLALIMAVSLLPMSVFATEADAEPDQNVEQSTEPAEDNSQEEKTTTSEEPADDGIATAYAAAVYDAATDADSFTVNEETPLTRNPVSSGNYRAVMLDCGRKYFSVENIKKLIDTMAQYGYNQLQLSFGNGGCRFLLDDMSLSFKDITLTSETVKTNITNGNNSFNGDERYLSQSDMDSIISYAKSKGIEIVPMLNMPGHATAIVYGTAYASSGNLNVNNETARYYGYALLKKYVDYFAGKDCQYFHFGADESGYTGADMTTFLTGCANVIVDAGMIPRAFNDATDVATMPTSVQITYWHQETGSKDASTLAAAGYEMINTHGRWYYVIKTAQNSERGTKYWQGTVRSKEVSVELPVLKAEVMDNGTWVGINEYFDGNPGSGSTISSSLGTMFCIWCDASQDSYLTDSDVISENENYGALHQIEKLAEHYWPDDINTGETGSGEVGGGEAGSTVDVDLNVGDTYTVDVSAQASDYNANEYIATATVAEGEAQAASIKEITSAADISADKKYLIVNQRNGLVLTDTTSYWYYNVDLELNGTASATNGNWWKITETTGDYTISYNGDTSKGLSIGSNTASVGTAGTITLSYNQTGGLTTNNVTYNGYWNISQNDYYFNNLGNTTNAGGWKDNSAPTDDGSKWTIYEIVEETTGGNTLTITGTGEGKTSVTVGDTTYNITVTAPETTESKTLAHSISFTLPEGAADVAVTGDAVTVSGTTITAGDTDGRATVTFVTKNAGGYVTARYTYNITVTDIDFNNIDALPVELWVTNSPIGQDENSNTNRWNGLSVVLSGSTTICTPATISINAEDVYAAGQGGVPLSSQVIAEGVTYNNDGSVKKYGDDNLIKYVYWKGVVLHDGVKQYHSNGPSGYDKSDKSGAGTDFEMIRYSGTAWQYLDTYGEWHDVKADDTLIAYYMQKFVVSPEVTTSIRDWGNIAGDGGGEGSSPFGWADAPKGFFGVGFAVVYGDKTMSPEDDQAIWNETLQLRYCYGEGTNPGFIMAYDTDDYRITKVTITRGYHADSAGNLITTEKTTWDRNDQVLWNKTTNDAGDTWYDETVIWREGDDRENGAIALNDETWGNTWVTTSGNNEAFLLLFYVEPVAKEDNLKVVYWDDNANTQINPQDITISVKDGVTFLDINQTSPVNEGTFVLDDDATIQNSAGVAQKFNKNITILDGVSANYRSGIYEYVSADISDDGKTLTLHYNLKPVENKHQFVVDFGLPVEFSGLLNWFNVTDKSTVSYLSVAKSQKVTVSTGLFGSIKINEATWDSMTYTLDKMLSAAAIIPLYCKLTTGEQTETQIEVIPASTVYYEDSFVTFTNGTGTAASATWTTDGTETPANQELQELGSKEIYGYDEAYQNSTTFSMGSAQKVTVTAAMAAGWTDSSAWPTATFTFKGTGFDIISLTDNTSGAIFVDVYQGTDTSGTPVKSYIVDNYYGYTQDTDGNWVVDTASTDNALYQIPVMKITGLDYGEYTAVVTVFYDGAFDHTTNNSYSFWLDAIRVYDPMGVDISLYKQDEEGYPQYIKLRDKLANGEGVTAEKNVVFIDGAAAAEIDTYANYGPNNEVYLAYGQAISFTVPENAAIATVQIGAKAPSGTAQMVVNNGDTTEISTATEMYYKLNVSSGNSVTITNNGSGILSLTNLKITFTEKQGDTVTLVTPSVEAQTFAVMSVRALFAAAPVEPEPEPTFAPERFEASWNSSTVRAGQKATLTVKTSEDVEAVMVDGVTIDTYRTRTQRTGWGRNAAKVTYREFTYTITAAETADYAVTAVNAEGIASEPITATLTVQAASQRPSFGGWLDKIFSRWF